MSDQVDDQVNDDPTNPDTKADKAPPEAAEIKPTVIGHIPASATLYGPHPVEGEPGATGSPGADLEREQVESQGENP